MEEIKVREYIRTINGEIFQIVGMKSSKDLTMYLTDQYGQYSENVLKQDIKKHSKKIIDLIEKGDFVNAYKITDILTNKINGNKILVSCQAKHNTVSQYTEDNTAIFIIQEDIKSVITKEQAKMMEYEVVQ